MKQFPFNATCLFLDAAAAAVYVVYIFPTVSLRRHPEVREGGVVDGTANVLCVCASECLLRHVSESLLEDI